MGIEPLRGIYRNSLVLSSLSWFKLKQLILDCCRSQNIYMLEYFKTNDKLRLEITSTNLYKW